MSTFDTQSLQSSQVATDEIELDINGRIVDYLDPSIARRDAPEERIRQSYARVLHEEYQYPKEWMLFEAPINIGSETRYADIAVFNSLEAKVARDQGRILLVVLSN